MKTLKFLSLSLVFLLFGCASTSSIISEFDEEVDFDSYSTYVLCIDDLFVENTNFPNHDNNEVRGIIGDAIEKQMEKRGHKTNVLNPELQAGFRLVVQEKEATFTNCDQQGEYEYWKECTIDTVIYTEETLVLYVSDINKNQVIWQASVTCDLNRSKNKIEGYVNQLVESLFNEYPKAR
ncbi:MAG: DUF4136 domain-containing protein [Flavobacteriaceae bacterium]|nr:DUF4136 domain-containing protein [Flavobacteriaceae bacterium]